VISRPRFTDRRYSTPDIGARGGTSVMLVMAMMTITTMIMTTMAVMTAMRALRVLGQALPGIAGQTLDES
jgi:hypothetical protein